ncbi:MAG: phage tail tape measure protein [Roseateles depolymerans]|uniref:Phage tail tape measure protein n=1 Tax=Roseateles depolymerans TaxID=76731 RepID=A0A2W5DL54_9BURK|nr:MAG: phage tail tape measure protein [Roseateles depolymerans]
MAISDLRLQVILQAIDRATAPLQRINAGSTATAKALRDTRDRLKELGAQQKSVGEFRELRTGLDATAAKLDNAKEKAARLARELSQAGPPTKAMTQQLAAARQVARDLGEQHQRQAAQVQALRDRLSAAGISTRELAQHEQRLRADIASTTQSIETQTAALRAQAAQQRRSAAAAEQLAKSQQLQARAAGAGVAMGATGAAIGAPVAVAVRDFASFEDHMLGVARQVNGARDDAGQLTAVYMAVRQQVQELGREIPLTTNEIADMVTAGARMEVPTDQLKDYTRTAAMMATAFDAVPGEIAEQMGKVGKNFKIPITQIEGLADSINYLDDNAISKGGEIINVLNRISGVVSTVKMSAQDAAALSSTLLTLGERPETAATAINAITQKLAAATKGTKKFQEAVAEIGLKSSDIQDGMATDAMATYDKVIAGIRALPEKTRVGVMVELVGLEHSDTLAKLVDKPEELQRQRALANGDQAKGSMRREADARNQTLSAQWIMAKNRAFELTTALGESLKPALIDLMGTLGRAATAVADFARNHPWLTAAVMKTAGALSVLLIVGGALTVALGSLIGPIALARYGLAMLGIKGPEIAAGLARAAGGLRLAGQAALWAGRALLTTPIGWLVLAIAAAGLLLVRYWQPVKAFFAGVWQGMAEGLAPLGAMFDGLFSALGRALAPLRPLWDGLVGALSAVWGWVSQLFEPFQATAEQLQGATASGRAFGQFLGTLAQFLLAPIMALGQLVTGIANLVGNFWGEARAAFTGGIGSIAALILNWSPVGLFYQAFAGVMRWFGFDLPQRFTEFGANLMQGLVSGITGGLAKVRDAISGAADGAIGWFKDKLGIRSPSRVFMDAGAEISNGAAAGVMNRSDGVRRAVLDMAAAATIAMPAAAMAGPGDLGSAGPVDPALVPFDRRPPVSAPSQAPAAAGATQISITINPAPGSDPQAIARAVAAELDRRERAKRSSRLSTLGDIS